MMVPNHQNLPPRFSLFRWILGAPHRVFITGVVLVSGLIALVCTGLVAFALFEKPASPSSTSSIVQALRQDALLGKEYQAAVATLKKQDLSPDDYCDQQAQLIDRLITAMKNIDISGCPDDFRQIYLKHVEAWHVFGDTYASHPHITSDGESAYGSLLIAALTEDAGSVFDYAAGAVQQNNDFVTTLKSYNRAIKDSWNDVQNVALAYGVKPSEYQ